MKVVILGTAHGKNVGGKRSPDNSLEEYRYSREIVNRLRTALEARGCVVYVDMPEDVVPLPQQQELRLRCNFVNKLCKKYGKDKCLYVSIHVNAAGGDGKWHEARGFSAHVGMNASAKSKALAQYLWNEAILQGLKGNRCVPYAKYIAQNLAICRDTNCPAVLTENLFQDNKEDVDLLLSEEGKEKVTAVHVKAIVEFIKDYYG